MVARSVRMNEWTKTHCLANLTVNVSQGSVAVVSRWCGSISNCYVAK